MSCIYFSTQYFFKQDAIQRMEAGNYTGNNVKNRPYRWQGKGPRPPHKQPPPKKSKKMTQIDQSLGEGDGEKVLKGKSRKAKAKTPKIAYSTTLKKVDTTDSRQSGGSGGSTDLLSQIQGFNKTKLTRQSQWKPHEVQTVF